MTDTHLMTETFAVGPLGCNCTILADTELGLGLIVDPGWDADLILKHVRHLDVEILAAVHTHGHIDHINATLGVHEALGTPAELHEADLFLYRGIQQQAHMLAAWGLPCDACQPPEPGRLIAHGDLVGRGRFEMEVRHTPGHTPGSLSFLLQAAGQTIVFSGDTLFQDGVGRTDLEGGDLQQLKTSIRQQLYALPDETLVVPGHGPSTTIGHEKSCNPFVPF